MAFDPDSLIKMGDVREAIRDELAEKITTVELIHILFELKKYAFSPDKTDKSDKTDKADESDEIGNTADALPRHRCGNCEHSEIIIDNDNNVLADCKLDHRIRSIRHAGCDRYQPIKEMVVKKDERRCWMCANFREDIYIKDEGFAYDCSSVGHCVKRQDKACRAFEPRPDIEVEP